MFLSLLWPIPFGSWITSLLTILLSIPKVVNKEPMWHLQVGKRFISALSPPLHIRINLPLPKAELPAVLIHLVLLSRVLHTHMFAAAQYQICLKSPIHINMLSWHKRAATAWCLELSQYWEQFLSTQLPVQHISCLTQLGDLSWGHASLFTFPPPKNHGILLQSGSCESEAGRFRHIQLALLPNKWMLSKEIQFLSFWGSHRVILWWLFLGGWGRRQFWWQIAPFRYEEPCKAEDVNKKLKNVPKRLTYIILGWRKYLTVRDQNSSICLSYQEEDWVVSWLQQISTLWGENTRC